MKELYENLRKHFDYLVVSILGPDYYNMAMDVYTSDDQSCKDIVQAFVTIIKKKNFWYKVAAISILLNIFFVMLVIIGVVS